MPLIRYIPNKFANVNYEYKAKPEKLAEAIYKFTLQYPEFTKPIMNKKTAIFVNGKNLNHDEAVACVLKDGDIVEITHSIEGHIAVIILYIAIAAMIAYLFYRMAAYLMESFDVGAEGDSGGTTYAWDGPSTGVSPESPVPLIYGEHLVGGQYINFNVRSDGKDNWLDLLVALGEGEIAGVMDEDQNGLVAAIPSVLEDVNTKAPYIKLNNQPATDYTDCLWAGKSGTNNQTSIKGFRNQQSAVNYDHAVPALRDVPSDNWTTIHTTNTDIDAFYVKLTIPALFTMYDSGKIKSHPIKYRIRYRVDSPEGPWIYSPPVSGSGVDHADSWHYIRAKTKSEIKIYKKVTVPARDTYDIQVQRYSPAWNDLTKKKTVEDKLNTTHITEVVNEELTFPNTALLAMNIKATDQISGSFPNVQTLVRGLKVRVPDLTNGGAGDKEFDDYYWTGSGEDFDLLVGSDPVTWNTTSYITQWTANPAYIIRDLLLNQRYGFGKVVSTSELDNESVDLCAKRCWQLVDSGHKNELHVVIDKEHEPTDILAQLAQVSRILMFWAGGYIKFKYEEDEDPVQLFTMGNIIKDSFKVDYMDHTKIPNCVEVSFADKDDGWKKNTVEVVDEAEWALGKAKRTKKMSLIGVTDKAQALREAKLYLNKGRYIRKGIEFITTMAACHSEPGDIIAFQHDVPQWGWGGRVLGGTSTTCIVDQDIPQNIIDDPTAYDIKIMHNDDTIETYDIVSVSGKTVTIGGGDTFSPVPSEDENYILGKKKKCK
jgi:predicted phage tail protein